MADENKKTAVAVDLNDPNLQPENLELNPDADAFTFPAPPPAGTYDAKLKVKQKDGSDFVRGTTKDGKSYLATQIEARLIIPSGDNQKYDNWPVFDNFVSTLVSQQTGTTRLAGILKALGVPVPAKTSDVELAKLLLNALAGEPSCKITIDWEGSADTGRTDDKGEKIYVRKKGMKNYPSDGAGGHRPSITVDGTDIQANATILKYLPA